MSKLCVSLPPFAPDYSGAAAALFELGGMIVIHDASGCTGNYTGFDEPRWFGSKSAVFCSGLRHMDAVLGNDEKLIHAVAEAAVSLNPHFIAVLGSPIPMVIGTDFKGIAHEIECVTKIPTIGIDTRGLAYYGKGIYEATVALMKKFVPQKTKTKPRSINILGMTPLDFYTSGNDKEFRSLFEKNGIEVLSCYYMGLTLKQLEASVMAQLNVAVSQAGVQVAEFMQKKYQIPYVVVTPLGDGKIAVKKVKNALLAEGEEYEPRLGEAEILIVGEQIISNSMREYLETVCHTGPIDVAILFDCTEKYKKKEDMIVKNELQLRKILNSQKYKFVIADPMIKALIKEENMEKINFHAFSHVAVSSKVHWEESINFLGDKMTAFLENVK